MRIKLTQPEHKTAVARVQAQARPAAAMAAPQPQGLAPTLLQLQRLQGNRFVQRMLQTHTVQAKLSISQPSDPYEQEADAIARQVVQRRSASSARDRDMALYSTPPIVSLQPLIQRQSTSFPEDSEERIEEEGHIQLKNTDAGPAEASVALEQQLATRAGSGQRLPATARREMEAGFGLSFEHVRIHTDQEAAQLSRSLNAVAFTYGNDIYFGADQFDPSSRHGAELLAHELTHTLQQGGVQRRCIQRRGGAAVGRLEIQTNVVNAGLTAGHAWLAYTPTAGTRTTYGTWGNRTPVGLHRDLELGYPAAATRATDLDATDHSALTSFAAANNAWGYINNCASFAARGWRAVASESLSYTSFGIPNPSALGAGITAANGGTATGTLVAAPPGAASSSKGSSL